MKLPLFVGTGVVSGNGLLDGLVSYWKADTNGSFPDAHGSNNGTIVGATFLASAKINGGQTFDGINDYVYFNDLGTFSAVTLSTWVKFTNVLGNGPISLGRYNLVGGNQIARINCRSTVSFQVGVPNSEISADLGSNKNDGNWHHIVGTWDKNGDGKARLYIDGVLEATSPTAKTDDYNPGGVAYGHIGGYAVDNNTTAPTWKFPGDVDEVGVWNTAITSDQVTDLYNSNSGLSYDDFTT